MSTTAEPGHAVPHRGLITVSIMLATIMQVLDTTIANVALPSMTGDLDASQDTITWVLTSYIVAAAIMTPVTGWLADRVGRRPVLLALGIGGAVLPIPMFFLMAQAGGGALLGAVPLAALGGGAARHHRLLVPAQPAGHLRQRLGFARMRHQIDIGGHLRRLLTDCTIG